LRGSKKASFWRWHGGTGQGRHCTYERLLPESMSKVWVTAGVPRPTVTTYSNVLREVPRVVGSVTTSPEGGWIISPAADAPRWMLSARSWSQRSISAALRMPVDWDGEHGPCRWYNGNHTRSEDGITEKVEELGRLSYKRIRPFAWMHLHTYP
jgi:hypothetical protein